MDEKSGTSVCTCLYRPSERPCVCSLMYAICPCVYVCKHIFMSFSSVRESVRAYPVTAHVPAKLRPVGVFTKLI